MKKKTKIKKLYEYLKPYKGRFIAALIFMILYAFFDWFVLTKLKDFINVIFERSDSVQMLLKIALLIPLIFAFTSICDYGRSYLLSYVGENVIKDLRLKLHNKLMSLSHDFYVRNSSAKMMSRVTNDLSIVSGAIVGVPSSLVKELLTFIFMAVYVFYLNWQFSLLVLVGLPLVAVPLYVFGKRLRKASKAGQQQTAEIYSSIHQMLNGFSVIKAFNTEKHEVARFQNENDKAYGISMGIVRVDARQSPFVEFIGGLAGALLLLLGGKDVISGVWSPGAFMVFFYAVTKMYKPIKNLAGVNSQIQNAISASERVFEVLDEVPSIKDAPGAAELKPFRNSIIYKDVTFGYTLEKDTIKNLNVEIKYGHTVAFVGHSGSGKTTLANLLLRFYDPKNGEIIIDGINIKNVTLDSLRKQIGIVTQDVTLFDNTVKYNISYGSFNASMDEIIAAAKNANAHSFISKLPNGYDTLVGERGAKLSGGEKQRISIARAMLKNPPILVLDEATSALDSTSEKLVQTAIDDLMKNRTVVLIAHRLATVRNANKIVVMDAGKIVESGTHEELIKLENGVYRKLNQMQSL
ncbi:ABC transporter ATP-binding protein [Endomicrobium proavitum]|uniref:Lipid A export ATP-binding/permease protein MsbA n=1 Tax=Endomicrobium proavitum TaxID=1408281 RepID=A0A0G3WIY1_9BACT|nr:ABC transporter transmembrane domain-containing protein [Endomicrobium proavitum]AKL97837.1 Lipid A export ATP-binding/permease protein MsbA [Endomicrobium proavitum]